MRPSQYPFNGYEQGPDFDRARSQIATPFQYIDIPLDVAGTNVIFNISGDFLYADPDPAGSLALGGISRAGFAVIELNNQQSSPVAPFFVQPGFAIAALFKQIKLSWTAQPTKLLRLMYSTGERVVPTNTGNITGSVSVVDGGLARTLMNQAYFSFVACAAVAGQYSHCQLWNPVGSGKNLYLENLYISTDTASAVQLYSTVSVLAGAGPNVFPKLIGGGMGKALAYYQASAAPIGSVAGPNLYLSANVPQLISMKEPICIPPNTGILVLSGINTTLVINFEWYEQ